MSRIDELIAIHCAKGVEFRPLADITSRSASIRWASVDGTAFRYIDLSSVDRVTRRIGDTVSVSAADAPSRARQIVRTGDVIFATTRPTQMRWAVIPEEYDGQIASTGYCVLRPDNDVILTNFLAHILGTGTFSRYVEANQIEGNYPSIPDSRVREFKVPVPPLEVQREIVRILDTFSKMEAELEAELEARKQQYEHYRRHIFLRSKNTDFLPLAEVCKSISAGGDRPKNLIKGQTVPTEEMPYPIFSNGTGNSALYGFTNSFRISTPAVTISARGTIGAHAIREAHFTPIVRLLVLIPDGQKIDIRYLNYALDIIEIGHSGGSIPQLTVPNVKKIEIPVPPMQEQVRIADALDKFDTLVNDLSAGLPAELVARRQQYEYYRDKLLTFKELEPAS